MESLANLEAFVRSAECRGFSAAARQLGLTPAAVSRNVAMLERNLGVRLFHRSTRRLTLTESGENFLETVRAHLEGVQAAIAAVTTDRDEPGGLLKISMPLNFGMDYLLPLVPGFLARYPRIRLDWRFENRQVDLIAEGYDAAIGGGFELTPGRWRGHWRRLISSPSLRRLTSMAGGNRWIPAICAISKAFKCAHRAPAAFVSG